MRKSEAIKVYELLEQWTRADVMSRMGRFDNLEFADYAMIKIEKENEIRELLYGTSNIAELYDKFGLGKRRKKKKKKKRSKKNEQ